MTERLGSLERGTKLGPYQIESPIGAGGMGEVYKATDTRLERTVAIKVLPAHVASDPERKSRFEREAKTISSLNHPNICTLHDVGREGEIDFLVMEYLEGETLAQRLTKGALPLDQALRYAIEIADALDKAHRQGVTHRDLKPANIMLTKAGAKLLDFGLAKLTRSGPQSEASTKLADSLTQQGTILGTFQYMAPEQLEGQDADARTDIWAFGCVVYEMVTGKKAFAGKSQASLIAAILEHDPPPVSAPDALTPPLLDRVIKTCLTKEPDGRFQSAGDVVLNLSWIDESATETAVATQQRALDWTRLRLVVAGVVLAVAAISSLATWWLAGLQPVEETAVRRAALPLPAEAAYLPRGQSQGANVAISPDGTRVVYAGGTGAQAQLYLRVLDQLGVSPIAGTAGALTPFFSPDGQWVAFFADGRLKKVPIGGGAPLTLCDVASGFGGTWSEDGTIVFAAALLAGLSRVSENGGTPQPFTTLAEGEGSHRWLAVVAGSRDVLFAVDVESSFSWDNARIAIQSLDESEHRVILDGGTSPRYLPTGHIVFARAGSLLAAPFDTASRSTGGPPLSLLQGVAMTDLMGDAHYALSTNGTLVYVPGGAEDFSRSLVWVDRTGNSEPLPIARRGFELPRLSPDGQRIALTIREGDLDIWVVELGRSTLTRLTSEAGEDHSVVWTPDGRQVTYSSTRGSQSHVLLKSADGSTGEEQLFVADQHQHLGGWTPDGRALVTDGTNTASGSDLYSWMLDEQSPPQVLIGTPFREQSPQLSPDGHWVAYRSDESGQNEVYVNAFPEPGARWQISPDGGAEPVWARDGRELFYRNGDKMMAVDVEMGSTFSAGVPRVLFEAQYARVVWQDANYDVDPNDQRFLMIEEAGAQRESPRHLDIVFNWFTELERLVPTP